jgi:hypothetical protein
MRHGTDRLSLFERSSGFTREKLLWAIVALVVGAQLAALWLLCSHQVRRAQVREATVQVQRSALADCMQYIPRATLHGCNARVGAASMPREQPAPAPALEPAAMSTAVSADTVFR